MFPFKHAPNALSFPTEHPHGKVAAAMEDGELTEALRWDLYSVAAGPARAAHDYEDQFRYTVGGVADWSDELRFDRRSGRLTSFVLKIGEVGFADDLVAASWLVLPRRRGVPVVHRHEEGLQLAPLEQRWLSREGDALLVLRGGVRHAEGDVLRLAIHAELDLLFHAGHYCGWMLHDPLGQLAQGSELAPRGSAPARPADDAAVISVLHDYLALVIQTNLDRMAARDDEMLLALEALRARLLAARPHSAAADGLAGRIEELLETFYS